MTPCPDGQPRRSPLTERRSSQGGDAQADPRRGRAHRGSGQLPAHPGHRARRSRVGAHDLPHFDNREGLLAAVSDYVDEQFDLARIRGTSYTYPELVERLGRLYRADTISDNGLVALFSTDVGLPIWREQCELARPGIMAALRQEHPEADEQSIGRLTDLMMVLLAIASVQVLRDVLGRSADEAGDTVQWAFDALVAAAKAPKT